MNNEQYLEHHGILGQKWGVRRYQNPDGTLTEAGRKRYNKDADREKIRSEIKNKLDAEYNKSEEAKAYKEWRKNNPEADEDDYGDYMDYKSIKEYELSSKSKELARDYSVLNKNYVKDQVAGSALVSSLMLAPVSAIAVGSTTKSGKAAVAAALVTVGGISAHAYISAKKEQINTEKKYDLRKKANKDIVSKDKVDHVEKARQQGARVLTNTKTQKQEELKRRNKMGMYNGNKSNW